MKRKIPGKLQTKKSINAGFNLLKIKLAINLTNKQI